MKSLLRHYFKLNSILPFGLLIVHLGIITHAANHLSPTWDEIAYPAAGLVQFKTGELRINTAAPYLPKLIYAIPLLPIKTTLPTQDTSWEKADEYRFGYKFTFNNIQSAKKIVFLSRLPVIFLSVLLALLIYKWAVSLFGFKGGMVALLSYICTPILISRGTVAQVEMPMYVCAFFGLWFHTKWFQQRQIKFLFASAFSVGLGVLCKLVILPLIPTVVILNLLFHPAKPSFTKRIFNICLFLLTVGFVVVIAYLPWSGGVLALKSMAMNLILFDKILPYYWAGHTYEKAPSLITYAALFVKAPLHIWVLGLWGAWEWKRSRTSMLEFAHIGLFALCSLGSVFYFKNAVSTIQLSPVYLCLCLLSSGVASTFAVNKKNIYLCFGILLFGALDVFSVHPNYIAYFNRLAGGSNAGYKWLADSDQDWGQSLIVLSDYLKSEGNPGVVLCYSGSGDPTAYGIAYQDLLSPALTTKDHVETPVLPSQTRVYLVIGTKVIQTEEDFLRWALLNLKPIKMVGQTFMVFDISTNKEAFEWMAQIYSLTNRPKLAHLSQARAQTISQ